VYENETICRRCGILVVLKNRKKSNVYCTDCKAKPVNVVTYGKNECVVWHGDYNRDNDWPMFEGKLVLPGKRKCGHSDCVNADHIEKEET
jgi:hypothetical protein